jgi:excisionase family DNA binding protein
MTAPTAPVEPLALSVRQAAAAVSVSERQIYILAERDGLPTVKIGGRRLVRVADLRAWLEAQPAAAQVQEGDVKRGEPDDRD